MRLFNMIAERMTIDGVDPFTILKDNKIRSDLFSSIHVSSTIGFLARLGIGACVCMIIWNGIKIAFGSGKLRNDAKEDVVHKITILILIGGSLGILEIFRQIAMNLAGL